MDTSWVIHKKKHISLYLIVMICALIIGWALVDQVEKYGPIFILKRLASFESVVQKDIQEYIAQEQQYVENFLIQQPAIMQQMSALAPVRQEQEITAGMQAAHISTRNKCFFVDPTGVITYSQQEKITQGSSIQTYKDLGTLFDNVNIVMQPLASAFVHEYTPKPAMYLAFPCIHDKKILGVLMVQLDENKVPEILEKRKTHASVLLAQGYGHKVNIIFGVNISEDQKKEGLSVHIIEPITLALQGNTGQSITTTPRGRKEANVRYYDIAAGWALVVQKDVTIFFTMAKMLKKTIALLVLILGIILCVWFVVIRKALSQWLEKEFNYIVFYFCICMLSAALIMLGFLIISHKHIKHNDVNQLQNDYHSKFDRASSVIAQDLNKMHYFVRAISLDFSIGKIKIKELVKVMDEYVIKYPFIEGAIIVHNPDMNNGEKKSLTFLDTHKVITNQRENLEDYTQSNWYKRTMENGSFWSAPITIKGIKEPVIAYAETFADMKTKKPLGVIAFLYPYKSLRDVAASIGIQKEEKTYIINSSGYFIYHSDLEYLVDRLTIYDLIHIVNPKVLEAYKKGLSGSSGSLALEENGKKEVVFFDSIPVSNWVMLSIFEQSEFQNFSLMLYHNFLFILLVVLAGLFATLLLIVVSENFDMQTIIRANTIFSIALLLGLVFILCMASKYLATRYDDSIIEGKMDVDLVMHDEKRAETLLPNKTGIFVNFLEAGPKVLVNAHTWQEKPDSEFEGDSAAHKEASGVIFKNKLEKQEVEKIGTTAQEGWDNICSLFMHKQSVFWFPFDAPLVEIVLAPESHAEDYFLYPDFASYKDLRPQSLPGINKDINLKDFIFMKSFFSYKPSNYRSFYEINKSDLVFNIVLGRNLINMFLIHIFPFIVILLALFVLLIVREKDKMALLSGYIALLFSLILVHQSFRTIAQVTEIVYLEYLYSIGYALLIMALIDTIFAFKNQTYHALRHTIFFDTLAVLTFCATLFAFYNL